MNCLAADRYLSTVPVLQVCADGRNLSRGQVTPLCSVVFLQDQFRLQDPEVL